MTPDFARNHFELLGLPVAYAVGSVILIAASLASKLISDQMIIPVGIVTTLVGIPFFIVTLMRSRVL